MTDNAPKSIFAIFALGAWCAGAEPRIESFSPSGYTKDASQVAVRFSEPMVALGDPDTTDPFAMACDVPGNGRWIDERHWVYDFAYDVPGAERCRFTLRRRVRTLAGEPVSGAREYSFHTGGPGIIDEPLASTDRWHPRIDERQVFLLALDADVDAGSIRRHGYCRTQRERHIAVDVVTGAERDAILDALPARFVSGLVESASTHLPRGDGATLRNRALRRIVAVRCMETLSAGARVRLVWGAGVASPDGVVNPTAESHFFRVRPAFTARPICSARLDGTCVGSIRVAFSAMVEREVAGRVRLVDAGGVELPTVVADALHVEQVEFEGTIAEASSYQVKLTGPLVDIDGRGLANEADFPLAVETGTPPTHGTFGHGMIIVPPGPDASAPGLFYRPPRTLHGRRLAVTDEKDLSRWLQQIEDARERQSRWGGRETPLLGEDEPGTAPFELAFHEQDAAFQTADVPLAGQGLQILELVLPPTTSIPEPRYVLGKAIATRLDVHFKLGRESSLVWVTSLADGRPVADAELAITDGCTGASLWRDRSDPDGLGRVSIALPTIEGCSRPHYLASARKDADYGFVALPTEHWQYEEGNRSLKGHTIVDRSLFQPGETVSMKHIVRLATADGFALPDPSMRSGQLSIRHETRGEVHSKAVDLDANGTATSTFELPETASLGHYDIALRVAETDLTTARFRVERFRVATLRAKVTTPVEPIIAPSSIPLDLDVQHLSGGGVSKLPVTVRTAFHRSHNDDFGDRGTPARSETRTVRETLDGSGKARLEVGDVPESQDRVSLRVEMDYRDNNGQIRTASNRISIWPAAFRLRVNVGGFATSQAGDPVAGSSPQPVARIRALDTAGSPVAGIAVEADFVMGTNYSLDERLPGGFRDLRSMRDRQVEGTCSGVTDADGTLACRIPAHLTEFEEHTSGGSVHAVVRATARDERGRTTRTSARIYPRRRDGILSVEGDRAFAPGETVPIRLSVPFGQANALVSVEREGVLDAFVVQLSGPRTINLPVLPNYAPNIQVSALAIATAEPNTGGGLPSTLETIGNRARVDLASRLPDKASGSIPIRVGKAANTLHVGVETDRDSYRTRDNARVRVTVEDPDKRPVRDAELALYAVDEGLLEIWPNRSANMLDRMLLQRAIDVSSRSGSDATSESLSLHSVAEEGRIGPGYYLPRGGPGIWFTVSTGAGPRPIANAFRREHFDPLLVWRGRLAVDDNGNAEIDIPLNDLVTSFRIVAIATAGAHLFGTGEATIRTTQDLVLHDALPPVVREGDSFHAAFTVRNASDVPQRLEVTAQAEGLPKLRPRTLTLPANASDEVSWRVRVPAGVGGLDWDVSARSDSANDRLGTRQTVEPEVSVRVQQATLVHLDRQLDFPVAPPANALPDRGGVAVSLQPSIAGGLGTMREYMAELPHTSLERRVSAAVALNDAERWSAVTANLETWMDEDGLLRFFPSDRLAGSPVLTAYVLAMADANGWTVPEHPRAQLLSGLQRYLGNEIVRHEPFPRAPPSLARLSALAALARHGGVEPDMLIDFEPNLELLPTSSLMDWIDTLQRVVPSHPDLATAKAILRSRLNLQGTSLAFSTEDRDRLWWLMVSTDGNAARAIATLLGDPDWHADMPRMMRGLVGRQQRGRWDTTVANAWGAVATARFAAAFENSPVSGTSLVEMGAEKHRPVWQPTGPPARVDMPWAAGNTLTLRHEGAGAPWGFVELRAAVPLRVAVSRGYRIARTVEAEGKRRRGWRRGDIAHVELAIDADRDMTWVVVEDALPPGAVVLGSGLGGDAAMLEDSYQRGDRWPVFTERGFDSYRAYFRYVPKGRTTLRYSVRYNTAGTFRLPPTRVEAMYAPEVYAEQPIAPLTIR
ncbi:MAG: MG2 domain-containing protein [Gammaproteobacteria bacterium]|nr:MG2 domain-containing protein [Gammaproteobacteria bacterium]